LAARIYKEMAAKFEAGGKFKTSKK